MAAVWMDSVQEDTDKLNQSWKELFDTVLNN